MATRLFVGNLPENTSESDLRAAFSSYGEIATLDLKTKTATGSESKKFAFVSLSGSNYNIEACIKHFTNEDFNGNRLYVTRARESFLERLQREREQAQKKESEKQEPQELPKKNPVIKLNEKLNPRKRNFDTEDDHAIHKPGKQEIEEVFQNKKPLFQNHGENDTYKLKKHNNSAEKLKTFKNNAHTLQNGDGTKAASDPVVDKKKHDSEMKRMESMKKKRQEFKEKKMIIKTGLTAVDKVQNTKIVFSDAEDTAPQNKDPSKTAKRNGNLFDDEDSGDDVDFAIKKQFEGKKGQKVLDLQSRYKSDKRFTLDERFIEGEQSDNEKEEDEESENIELEQKDEKNKQLDILQDVLGITLKRKIPQEDMKNKPKLGMLRFDPSQPEHARFLAPVEPKKQENTKKGKKKLKEPDANEEPKPEEVRPEVSKEQFYKVSETLKEAIAQSNTFSLRSLFGNNEPVEEELREDENYLPLEAPKKPRVKNPLETKDKNPFVYDSSESENEDEPELKTEILPVGSETKAVWKENLFFNDADQRLKEGLAFFSNSNEETHKERRELKSLVKKRIYNKERKNQMFQKKIGGRRKTMKKSFRKKA